MKATMMVEVYVREHFHSSVASIHICTYT